jgi:hypothetical protein
MTFQEIENAPKDTCIEFNFDSALWVWLCAAGYQPVSQEGSRHVMRRCLKARENVEQLRPDWPMAIQRLH